MPGTACGARHRPSTFRSCSRPRCAGRPERDRLPLRWGDGCLAPHAVPGTGYLLGHSRSSARTTIWSASTRTISARRRPSARRTPGRRGRRRRARSRSPRRRGRARPRSPTAACGRGRPGAGACGRSRPRRRLGGRGRRTMAGRRAAAAPRAARLRRSPSSSAVGAASSAAPRAGRRAGCTGGGRRPRPSAASRRRMPCCGAEGRDHAGVELSVWAIQMSVRPCSTHWRISSRYGLRVAFCVVTAGKHIGPSDARRRRVLSNMDGPVLISC